MDLAQARSLLGQHWSSFVGAVFDPTVRNTPGGVQMYVWQSLNNYYLSRGQPLPQNSFTAVNRLLGLAGQQRAASLNLAQALSALERTGIDAGITSAHIAPAIDARDTSRLPLGPGYRVVYLSREIVGGVAQLVYRTHDMGRNLAQTLDRLREIVNLSAQLNAADYENEWDGLAVPVSIQSY